MALPYLFEFWALEHQLPPLINWKKWIILGGRGSGKTRAGAEWVRSQVEGALPETLGAAKRIALIGDTYEQARDVMVHGESGILACSPADRRPLWQASRRRLLWPNGAIAEICAAYDYEALRGRQFDAAWADELAKWKHADKAWDMLQFTLRLGENPRQCVSTTPRNMQLLKTLMAAPSSCITHAPTEANKANLAVSFLEEVRRRYAGTRLERQELDGLLVEDLENALWTDVVLKAVQVKQAPELDRIVVAIDPPMTGHKASNACGIIVAGLRAKGPEQSWKAYVLCDATITGSSPSAWANIAVKAFHQWGAQRVIAEVNQGGDLVEAVLRQVAPMVPYKAVRAKFGKSMRAEPVAALYEQGRVFHLPGLNALEHQMCEMTLHGFQGQGSPDRVEALVWAVRELMLKPPAKSIKPRMRLL